MKKRPQRATTKPKRTSRPRRARSATVDLPPPLGARPAATPGTLAPQLATLADGPPDGDEWLHEVKFDGYRLLAVRDRRGTRLLTRRGLDWTAKFPGIAEAVAALSFTGILDGELVVMDRRGVSDFQQLQNAIRERLQNRLVFCVFDLPYCDGYDLRRAALVDRKDRLERIVRTAYPRNNGPIRYSEHAVGGGRDLLTAACDKGLEGIVSKRSDAKYESRRTLTWLKSKCLGRQEFVIGGFTRAQRSRIGFGSLLLGYYDADGRLHYAGNVGTGFDDALLRDLKRRLDRLVVDKSPFVEPPPPEIRRRGITWVRPQLVGEVRFTEWTADGVLRHPSFQGLREDKRATEVVRETTVREELRDGK